MKRYQPKSWDDRDMEPHAAGDWVRQSDAQRLLDAMDRLVNAVQCNASDEIRDALDAAEAALKDYGHGIVGTGGNGQPCGGLGAGGGTETAITTPTGSAYISSGGGGGFDQVKHAAERDAARYRWLRANPIMAEVLFSRVIMDKWSVEELDAAIDRDREAT